MNSPSRRSRRTRGLLMLSAVLALTMACDAASVTNLPRARSGARCAQPGAFARDNSNVLQCSARRRWAVNMPIARAISMIEAYNRSRTPASLLRLEGSPIVTAGSTDRIRLSYRVSNQNNEPLAQAKVVVAQLPESGILGRSLMLASPVELVSNADGLVTLDAPTPTSSGLAVLEARVKETNIVATKHFVSVRPAAPAAIVPLPASIVAAQRTWIALSARVTDRFGNPAYGVPVEVYSDDPGSLSVSSAMSGGDFETDSNGVFTINVETGDVTDTFSVAFVVDGESSALFAETLLTIQ